MQESIALANQMQHTRTHTSGLGPVCREDPEGKEPEGQDPEKPEALGLAPDQVKFHHGLRGAPHATESQPVAIFLLQGDAVPEP